MEKYILEGYIESFESGVIDPAFWVPSRFEFASEKKANEFGEENMLPGFTVRKVEEKDDLPF